VYSGKSGIPKGNVQNRVMELKEMARAGLLALIHPSAWKSNLANFGFRVLGNSLRKDQISSI
jgi:hypothetical protein